MSKSRPISKSYIQPRTLADYDRQLRGASQEGYLEKKSFKKRNYGQIASHTHAHLHHTEIHHQRHHSPHYHHHHHHTNTNTNTNNMNTNTTNTNNMNTNTMNSTTNTSKSPLPTNTNADTDNNSPNNKHNDNDNGSSLQLSISPPSSMTRIRSATLGSYPSTSNNGVSVAQAQAQEQQLSSINNINTDHHLSSSPPSQPPSIVISNNKKNNTNHNNNPNQVESTLSTSLQNQNNNNSLTSSYIAEQQLRKQQSNLRMWKQRWVVLRGNTITYFKSKDLCDNGYYPSSFMDDDPKDPHHYGNKGEAEGGGYGYGYGYGKSIELRNIISIKILNSFTFAFVTHQREYVFRANSKNDVQEWLFAFQQAMAAELNEMKVRQDLALRKRDLLFGYNNTITGTLNGGSDHNNISLNLDDHQQDSHHDFDNNNNNNNRNSCNNNNNNNSTIYYKTRKLRCSSTQKGQRNNNNDVDHLNRNSVQNSNVINKINNLEIFEREDNTVFNQQNDHDHDNDNSSNDGSGYHIETRVQSISLESARESAYAYQHHHQHREKSQSYVIDTPTRRHFSIDDDHHNRNRNNNNNNNFNNIDMNIPSDESSPIPFGSNIKLSDVPNIFLSGSSSLDLNNDVQRTHSEPFTTLSKRADSSPSSNNNRDLYGGGNLDISRSPPSPPVISSSLVNVFPSTGSSSLNNKMGNNLLSQTTRSSNKGGGIVPEAPAPSPAGKYIPPHMRNRISNNNEESSAGGGSNSRRSFQEFDDEISDNGGAFFDIDDNLNDGNNNNNNNKAYKSPSSGETSPVQPAKYLPPFMRKRLERNITDDDDGGCVFEMSFEEKDFIETFGEDNEFNTAIHTPLTHNNNYNNNTNTNESGFRKLKKRNSSFYEEKTSPERPILWKGLLLKGSLQTAAGAYSVIGQRETNEDEFVSISDFNEYIRTSSDTEINSSSKINNSIPTEFQGFHAIFDGHCGPEASIFLRDKFHSLLAEQNCFGNDLDQAFIQAFKMADDIFLERCAQEGLYCGTTAIVAFIRGNILTVANLGDCAGVLSRNGVSIPMSIPHSPGREDEAVRIKNANGWITEEKELFLSQLRRMDLTDPLIAEQAERRVTNFVTIYRVCGELAVSRGIGDTDFKGFNGNPAIGFAFPDDHSTIFTEDLISVVPEFEQIEITEEDECLILACDGFWDVIEPQEAVDKIKELMVQGVHPTVASKQMCELATRLGSSDNVTVVILYFKIVTSNDNNYNTT